jgi:cysteinyl-tRNA synthetase
MHNGMVESGAEKMSKSDGNIFQLSEALDRYGREAVVAYLISGHYRQPLAFGDEQMRQAVAQVERLRNFFREHGRAGEGESGEVSPSRTAGGSVETSPDSRLESFRSALADDFNTPRAMAEAFELVGEVNRGEAASAAGATALGEMVELVGLGSLMERGEGADAAAEELMAEREEARAGKNFERADAIRDELAELGWEVRDSADGPRLVPKA